MTVGLRAAPQPASHQSAPGGETGVETCTCSVRVHLDKGSYCLLTLYVRNCTGKSGSRLNSHGPRRPFSAWRRSLKVFHSGGLFAPKQCHRNCYSPSGNQQNLSSRGHGRKQGWVLVVCAVRGPRDQGPLGATVVSPAQRGPRQPGSQLPGAVAQRLCSGPGATVSQDAWEWWRGGVLRSQKGAP